MVAFHFPTSHVANLPVSTANLATFISYLSCNQFSPSTIVSYVSAIGYVHRLAAVHDPTASYLIQKLLAGATKLSPSVDPRLPITTIILNLLVNSLPQVVSNQYNIRLLKAMFIVAFYGLMRVGEITSFPKKEPSLMVHHLALTGSLATVTISKFKHNSSTHPVDILMPRQSSLAICPVASLYSYMDVRGFSGGPLFCFPDGAPVPRSFFTQKLRQCLTFVGLDPSKYKSHSFRIGGASYYAELGYSDAQIRLLGRWKADTFKRYIRSSRIHPPLPVA